MEFGKTKLNGMEVNVLFTGAKYYFCNSYHGIVAICTRDYEKSVHDSAKGISKEVITLTVGNHSCAGGSFSDSAVITMCKRYINKNESRYIHTDVTYLTEKKDLASCSLQIKESF